MFLAIRFFGGKSLLFDFWTLNHRKASFTPMLQRNCSSFFYYFNSFIFPCKFLLYLRFVMMYIVYSMDSNLSFSERYLVVPTCYIIYVGYICIYLGHQFYLTKRDMKNDCLQFPSFCLLY